MIRDTPAARIGNAFDLSALRRALGALAQGAAIVAGFLSLSFALRWRPAFVVGCAVLAAAAVSPRSRARRTSCVAYATSAPHAMRRSQYIVIRIKHERMTIA
ncbi:hypothetical protein WS71_01920 [Burkholderia mayonis]|uniref:Uncharacterized protein n=1 Tax=Burkholderia mayonis TaxID=1385591 RepID=A0A1B4FRB2_9BURK|nr:hypothetical protein [Burkholderia mayonis]AOJ06220.1 hypothetical protein WS71_01920 [Burkholderia mayonis]KVE56715.1 hypothetical protein WS71_01330 [Burkholderia mayonis]